MRYLILILFLFLVACDKDKVKDIGQCNEFLFVDDNYLEKIAVLEENSNYAQTGNEAEFYRCLDAPDTHDFEFRSEFRVIYSIKIEKAEIGDILHFYANGEITNETPKPMFVAFYLAIADDPLDVFGNIITKEHGYNISVNMHHGVVSENGAYLVNETIENKYLNFVIYAASGEKKLKNEFVIIEPNYGSLTVVRQRN